MKEWRFTSHVGVYQCVLYSSRHSRYTFGRDNCFDYIASGLFFSSLFSVLFLLIFIHFNKLFFSRCFFPRFCMYALFIVAAGAGANSIIVLLFLLLLLLFDVAVDFILVVFVILLFSNRTETSAKLANSRKEQMRTEK